MKLFCCIIKLINLQIIGVSFENVTLTVEQLSGSVRIKVSHVFADNVSAGLEQRFKNISLLFFTLKFKNFL